MCLISLLKHSTNIKCLFCFQQCMHKQHTRDRLPFPEKWDWVGTVQYQYFVPVLQNSTLDHCTNWLLVNTHKVPNAFIPKAGPSYHLPLEETHCRHLVINFLPKLLLQPPPGIAHGMHLYWTLQHHGHKALQETEKCFTRLNLVKPTTRKQIKNPQTDMRTTVQSHGMSKIVLPHSELGLVFPKRIRKRKCCTFLQSGCLWDQVITCYTCTVTEMEKIPDKGETTIAQTNLFACKMSLVKLRASKSPVTTVSGEILLILITKKITDFKLLPGRADFS